MNYNKVQFEFAAGTVEQLKPSDLPEICFSGRSNVGKSSLINAVLGRKSLARVSAQPGKTVTVNSYLLENIRLIDLPGYGYAKVAQSEKVRWSKLMEGYFSSGRNIQLVFQLVDMRHTPSQDDMDMLHYLIQLGFPFAVVLTKADKLKVTARKEREVALEKELDFLPEDTPVIPFSSVKGEGIPEIRHWIELVAGEEI